MMKKELLYHVNRLSKLENLYAEGINSIDSYLYDCSNHTEIYGYTSAEISYLRNNMQYITIEVMLARENSALGASMPYLLKDNDNNLFDNICNKNIIGRLNDNFEETGNSIYPVIEKEKHNNKNYVVIPNEVLENVKINIKYFNFGLYKKDQFVNFDEFMNSNLQENEKDDFSGFVYLFIRLKDKYISIPSEKDEITIYYFKYFGKFYLVERTEKPKLILNKYINLIVGK